MIPWRILLIPAAAALIWTACDRPDTTEPETGLSGAARVAVPALPADYLPPGGRAILYLDVTGPGMNPIRLATSLAEGQAQTVEVKGIPPGPSRVFHGLLVRVDSALGDTTATHEGGDTAAVAAGRIADVHLFLRSKAGGSARVCLDVEGWPANPACDSTDTLPPPPRTYPYVGGCYNLSVTKPGPAEDSVFHGKLRLTQRDSTVLAVVAWSAFARDTARGWVTPGSPAILYLPEGQFTMKAFFDSAQGIYGGSFNAPSRGVYGTASAGYAPCDSIVPPNETVKFDRLECWQVAQHTADGRSMNGTLWAGWRAASVIGWFQWSDGAAFAMDNDSLPASGNTLYLFGTLPGGFAHPARSAIERGHYKARIAAGVLESGAAYASASGDFGTADRFAEWKGMSYACPDSARAILARLPSGKPQPIVLF